MDRGAWQAMVHRITKSQTCMHAEKQKQKQQLEIISFSGQKYSSGSKDTWLL